MGWHITAGRSLLMVLLLVALILAVADLLFVVLGVLLLVFAGILFSIFLNVPSRWLSERTPISYGWALTLVVTFLLLAAAGVGYYLGSQIVAQAADLFGELRISAERLVRHVQQNHWVQQYLPKSDDAQGAVLSAQSLQVAIGGLQWGAWAMTGPLVIFFIGLFLAIDPALYQRGLLRLVPRDRRPRWQQVLSKLRTELGYWIVGRLLSMLIIGVLVSFTLALIGIPLAVPLGILAALLTFIPNLGPLLALIPQVLMASQVGSEAVWAVVAFNLVIEAAESYLFTPTIQQYQVSLPPAVTIFAQLLMGLLLGVLGILLAAPLAVVVMLLLQKFYIEDYLGDPVPM